MLVHFSCICLKYVTTLLHDLLIAKFLLDYLSLRKHRTKVSSSFSKWSEICREILKSSMLGMLLFNILINAIFFLVEKSEISNFAYGSTIYSSGKDLPKIKEYWIVLRKTY